MAGNTKSTCVVLLNWNGRQDTLDCLDSLFKQKPLPEGIVICDNASTDDSVSIIIKQLQNKYNYSFIKKNSKFIQTSSSSPHLTVIVNDSNKGFAAGNNPGILSALQKGYDYIWLLNNDTIVHENTFQALKKCAEDHPAYAVWGSTVLEPGSSQTIQCAGGCFYNPLTTVFTPAMKGQSISRIQAAPEPGLAYIYGASMFIPRQIFEKIGLLCTDYFLFYEELDFCGRAMKAGFTLCWCRGSIIEHKQGSSLSRVHQVARTREVLLAYHENLSTLIYTARHHPYLLLPAMFLRLAGKIFIAIIRGKSYLLSPLMRAYLNFLFRKYP